MSDYEKKYKEALARAREINLSNDEMEYLFPELKESYDERIRKELIAIYSVGARGNMKTGDIPDKDIVAWLEKQGEKTQQTPRWMINFLNENRCKFASSMDDYDEQREAEGKLNTIIAWLKKQGEQKPQGKAALEVINEEKVDNQFCVKPVNKVEPKFKVGDWIIGKSTNNEPRQISEITDQCYKSTYGGQYSFSSEDELHLWSIKDAKDGDILYTPKGLGVEGVFLVSGWQQIEGTGKTLCSYIGYRVDDDEIVEGGLGAIWWKGVKDPFFPATKEQRDKLEKAMANAGYTFDFDKKELKKIEDEIEIPYGAKDSELQEATYYTHKGFHAEIDGDKVVIRKGEKQGTQPRYNIGDILCDKLCTTLNKDAQPNMEIVDIKNGMYICDKGSFPVSQQDEYVLVGKRIDSKLNDNSVSNELRAASFAHAKKEILNHTFPNNEEFELAYTFEKGAKWNAAQKPTWSEKHIADVFEKVGLAKIVREQSNDALTIALQDAMIELSKATLQPKSTTWSEEDENLLKLSFENLTELKDRYGEEYGKVGDCISWLTSLKDRSTWKPRDAQMIALNDVITNRHLSNANERILKGLQEQLKKLK